MSIRNLDFLFDPASVAVFGASTRIASVGATVLRNLRSGGFAGPVFAVNPKYAEIDGQPAYAGVGKLPQAVDLAVICTPPATVPGLIADIGRAGTRAAIVLTGGFDSAVKQRMLDAARPRLLRILGPNCIGMLNPRLGLNASFAHIGALPGELAFVTQSGALLTAVLDWATGRGIGFSRLVSLGERADVDLGDVLDFLASDPGTRSILLYVETIEAARKFMSAARAASRNKPVIVVKAGRAGTGVRAATSHTGALAGSDVVVDAAIRRAGMLRVDTLQDLFLAAETLAHFRGNRSESLAIMTNGGGAGVMAADAAALGGTPLAELAPATVERLAALLPPTWPGTNPVDIAGDAPTQRYVDTLQALLADPGAHAVLFMHAPTAIVGSEDIARACVPVAREAPHRVIGCWLGDAAVAAARHLFQDAGVPCYDTPEQAVRAFSMLETYRRNQELLLEAPGSTGLGPVPDLEAARTLVSAVLAAGRETLSEPQAKALLRACGVPVVPTRAVGLDLEAAVAAADDIGYPVVLKILSPDIAHKSDIGGVALDLAEPGAVREAARTMLRRVRAAAPEALIEGFSVQPMVKRKQAHELIAGAGIDDVFGPVVLFGAGGTAVEVLADHAVGLPPLNRPLARAMVARTRVSRLLGGYRDRPAVQLDAVLDVLIAVSQMLADLPELVELHINPLLVDAGGVIALDARARVRAAPAHRERFAIRPYPVQLEETLPWDGQLVLLRPIRPQDEAQHREFLESLDPEDVRMRIFSSRRNIERTELARLAQIDYEREMAFIAQGVGADGEPRTLGTVRAVTDPDNDEAEFGIVVRSELKGRGLGRLLLDKLIRYARERGTRRLVATVLRENAPMLALARGRGFEPVGTPEAGGDTRTVALELR